MKVRNIFAISLAASSFSCLAFKSPPNVVPGTAPDNVRTLESKILGSFYSQHGISHLTTIAKFLFFFPRSEFSTNFPLPFFFVLKKADSNSGLSFFVRLW